MYRLSVRHQRHRAARAVGELGLRIDAHQVIERGQDVLGGDGAFDDAAGVFVSLADDLAASHAATGKDTAVSLRPMIPSAAANVLNLRRSAMLAYAEDERLVEQAASIQIVDQPVKSHI